tara:strand:+ start:19311 stop:21224 length:1914 start_codon:yes stop_codon:yes gene_type:complete
MNKLLTKYIKNYLTESPVPYAGRYVSADIQHKLSPNISKDMTGLSTEAVLKILMKNIDERTCISFVNTYDENIPSFNINPSARYHTPHGNYAYPLTLDNLRELIETGKIDGTDFAVDRPYFLLFKINSPNTIFINKDGNTNYNSVRSARRSDAKSRVISVEDDINTIIRNFIYFVRTSSVVNPKSQEWSSLDSDIYYKQQPFAYSKLEDKFEGLLNKDITTETFVNQFGTGLRNFLTKSCSLTYRNKVPSSIEKHFFDETFNLLKEYLVELSNSEINKFYKGDEETDDFHKIYFICWLLSQIGVVSNRRKNNGPILTLLLRSIGLDGIIDQGSSTLHKHEPTQSVSLSFGNIKADNIDFLGTFENIFDTEDSRSTLNDIAAEIYREEGFKYDTDFFSKNENPMGNIAGSTVYTYLEDLLLSYHHDDVILNRGLSIEGGSLKVRFDLYADFIDDYELAKVQELIKLMLRAILKSPHKDKIKIDLGLSLFDYDAKIDVSEFIKKLYAMQHFELLIEDFSGVAGAQIKLDDHDGVFDYMTRSFLTYDQELINAIRPSYTEIILQQGCGIAIIIKDRFYLDELLVGNGYIFLNVSAPITFDLTGMSLFRFKKMEKHADHEQEKQKIIQKINKKLPKAKVKI